MVKLQKVLVAYDGSPQSKEALHWAIYFGRRTGAEVSAIKVFEPFLTESKWDEVGVLPEEEVFAKFASAQKKDLQLMEDVKELGRGQEIEITTAVLHGHVAQTILEYAKKNDISLIVTGTRGYGALKQLMLGSVTHGLVSLSDVPVLVVKKCPVVQYTGKTLTMTTMRKILVAFDGYPQSVAALSWAVEIAKLIDAQVTAVKVFEPFLSVVQTLEPWVYRFGRLFYIAKIVNTRLNTMLPKPNCSLGRHRRISQQFGVIF